MTYKIMRGDCRGLMAALAAGSIDSIVTDPPYELGFMGKGWDSTGVANDIETWRAALRVLKPGGYLLAFSGTRTYHRMVCAIEDAGFEIRDQIGWVYGSGFPKSLDVSKAIDKAAGVEGTFGAPKSAAHAGWIDRGRMRGNEGHEGYQRPWMADKELVDRAARQYVGGSEAARQWQGWGTALKPAWEPIVVARKPLIGTVAANVLAHGTGGLNIDGCRVPGEKPDTTHGASARGTSLEGGALAAQGRILDDGLGRWPANIIHDGSDEVLAAFPQAPAQMADASNSDTPRAGQNVYGAMKRVNGREGEASADSANEGAVGFKMRPGARRLDEGSAARFFYCAKTDSGDRHDGLAHPGPQFISGSTLRDAETIGRQQKGNHHPTVKPTALMRYLCRLVTPPGGVVLDPFMGSGSTLKAAELEGFSAIGIELDPAYIEIARRRIASDAPLFAEVEVTA